jgi:hypothetical protein
LAALVPDPDQIALPHSAPPRVVDMALDDDPVRRRCRSMWRLPEFRK